MSNTANNTPTILIMAGGTGGHIFPALAISNELKKHSVNIQWLGSSQGMENTIVPKHNIKLHTITAVGLRGKSVINLLKAPFLLAYAALQAIKIFMQIKPTTVLGMGGFTAGIGGVVAWLFNIPLVIHEQNAIAGTTNKLLNRLSRQSFQAFDNALPQAITAGNPIAFTPVEKQHNKQHNEKLNLLIIGGSLGSKPINDVVTKLTMNINIWHQTGQQHFDAIKAQYQNQAAKVTPFIDDMSDAYGWADVVLCRAGAMTVSELMLSATASILVPLPHAIDNHQFHNALALSDNHAGILIEQFEFNIEWLEQTLQQLTQDKLTQMGANAQQLAKPNAAQDVANYLLSLKN